MHHPVPDQYAVLSALRTKLIANKPITDFNGEFGFLNMSYRHPVEYDAVAYPSLLHAFIASKFGPPEARAEIREFVGSPYQLRVFAKKFEPRVMWKWKRLTIMHKLLQRFYQDPLMAQKMLATGERPIVFVNNAKDSYWGQYKGEGTNHYGRLQTRVRDELIVAHAAHSIHPTLRATSMGATVVDSGGILEVGSGGTGDTVTKVDEVSDSP